MCFKMDKDKVTKRKGGPIKKVIKDGIIKELTKIVESGNILGITNQQLADKFSASYKINIKRQTIGDCLKKVYASIPSEDVHNTKVKIEVMFNKVFRAVQEMIANANDQKEKKEAIDLLLRAMDKFTDFLERFGIKPKVADEVNVKALVVNANIDVIAESQNILNDI